MKPIEITFTKQDKYLSDALIRAGHKLLPSNRVINKTLTGIGATHMEIKAPRHSIIIEPNVPVIMGKIKSHPECIGVYKVGSTDKAIKKYLQNPDVKYKKLLTTPESFYRICNIATELCIDIYADYFCLFDECEKIGQDYDFRNSIAFPIADFFKFNDKAFISATPLKTLNKELVKLKFGELLIKPDFDYQVDLELITTNVFMRIVEAKIQELLDNKSECICLFFNSIKGIKMIIERFKIPSDKYTIFCSDSRHNELKVNAFSVEDHVDNSTIKQINFFTSRYYSAVDFNLSVCPDIVLLTNQTIAEHSKIDPLSEAIQIQGRFRNTQQNDKRINSMCHISDLVPLDFLTPEGIDETMKEWLQTANDLKVRYNKADSRIIKSAILHEYQQGPIFPYFITPDFQTDFEINIFSVLNRIYKERVNSHYCSKESLFQAYSEAGYFNVTPTDKFDYSFSFSDLDLSPLFITKNKSQKDLIQIILNQIQLGVPPDQILALVQNNSGAELYVNAGYVIEAQKLLGSTKVSKLKSFKDVKTLIDKTKIINQNAFARVSKQVIEDIISEFTPDLKAPIAKKDIQSRLQSIFDKHKLLKPNDKPFVVSQDTITQYFDKPKEDNRTGKNTYTLFSLKPEFLEIINPKAE
jgi:hypothetical protein